MSYALANAITGTYLDYQIDPNKVLISRDSLTPDASTSVAVADGNMEIRWNDNSGVGSAKQIDRTLVAIVNSDKGEAITDTAGMERTEGTQTVVPPADSAAVK